MRPADFAGQLNVSLANGWGIVRTVADLCLKQPEGKYVLIKDPNRVGASFCYSKLIHLSYHSGQPVIRLYAVPMNAFAVEEEEADAVEAEEPESAA